METKQGISNNFILTKDKKEEERHFLKFIEKIINVQGANALFRKINHSLKLTS